MHETNTRLLMTVRQTSKLSNKGLLSFREDTEHAPLPGDGPVQGLIGVVQGGTGSFSLPDCGAQIGVC